MRGKNAKEREEGRGEGMGKKKFCLIEEKEVWEVGGKGNRTKEERKMEKRTEREVGSGRGE